MNKKINDFNRDWYNYKQSSFATILRSIVDAFYENVYQYKNIFKEIMLINLRPNPQFQSKKSIIPINPLNFRNSLKKTINLNENDEILERKSKVIFEENSMESSENVRKFMRKSTSFFENNNKYCQFNQHLNKLMINMEDENLKYLEEGEIVMIFKGVLNEMNKKYDDYKNNLTDCLRFYKEIREVYLEEIIEGKESYAGALGDFLQAKFIKVFSKKKGNYLALFEIVVMKMRTYTENIKNYIEVFDDFSFGF